MNDEMPHSALLSITFFPTIQKLHRAIALGVSTSISRAEYIMSRYEFFTLTISAAMLIAISSGV